jgi:hypothetical protein
MTTITMTTAEQAIIELALLNLKIENRNKYGAGHPLVREIEELEIKVSAAEEIDPLMVRPKKVYPKKKK